MSERTEAVAVVRKLMAQADSTTFDAEREAFTAKAVQLRLKHGISDAELEADAEEELELLGFKVFYYSNKIRPRFRRIEDEIDTIKDLLSTERLEDQVENHIRVRDDLKNLLARFERDRDARIKELYDREFDAAMAEWDDEEGKDHPEIIRMTHERALTSVKFRTVDMRRDQIERIVGRSSKALWAQSVKLMQAKEAANG